MTVTPREARPVAAVTTFASGRYRVERTLGSGGQKIVYLVRDSVLERDCALSLIRADALGTEEVVRLRREAQALAQVGSHPNVVTVFDLGEEQGSAYLVCEYVPGGDLAALIDRACGPLPLTDAMRITRDLLRALAFVHAHGIVHRDLKPGNVWLDGGGGAKLGDFGLALTTKVSRLTEAGTILGTPTYIAPEQLRGEAVDGRADLYALGCVLYEMLTGRPPFLGDTLAVISQHLHATPSKPGARNDAVSAELDRFVLQLLARSPEQRPASAEAALLELECALVAPASATDAAAPPLSRLARLPFVGRKQEFESIASALDDALEGRASLRVIAGEPGIGKTRLAQEIALLARRRGARVLTGRCSEAEGSTPYLPFVEALDAAFRDDTTERLREHLGAEAAITARLLPGLATRLGALPAAPQMDPSSERYVLFKAVTDLLHGVARPAGLLLVLDDLHWADRPSLALLQHLMRASGSARLLVVGTYRDAEVDARHPLSVVVTDLRRERLCERVSLRGIDLPEVRDLLARVAGGGLSATFAEALARGTEGHPLFIEEILKSLVEEGRIRAEGSSFELGDVPFEELGLPEGIRDLIHRRLARLNEVCARTLTVASAMGETFRWELLVAACQDPEDVLLDVLDEALAAQVLRERKEGATTLYDFTHALLRQTLYADLSAPRRARLHRRIGEAVERLHVNNLDPQLATLAHHFGLAGDEVLDKAIDYAIRAGDRALTLLAFEAASGHYERALELLGSEATSEGRRERLLALHLKRARGFVSVMRAPDARAAFEAAYALMPRDGGVDRAELLLDLSMACHFCFDPVAMGRYASEARDIAERLGRNNLAAGALICLGIVESNAGGPAAGVALFRRAREVAEVGWYRRSLSFAGPLGLYHHGQIDESLPWARADSEEARRNNDLSHLAFGQPTVGLALAASGRVGEAMHVLEDIRTIAKKYGIKAPLARLTSMLAGVHMEVADFAGAEALAEEAREIARGIPWPPAVVSAGIDLLFTYVRRGDVGRAEALVDEVSAASKRTAGWHDYIWTSRINVVRAEMALARDDAEGGLRWSDEAIAGARQHGRAKYELLGRVARARAMASLGRSADAIVELRETLAPARAVGGPTLFLRAARALLELDGDEVLADETRRAVEEVAAGLPEALQATFRASQARAV